MGNKGFISIPIIIIIVLGTVVAGGVGYAGVTTYQKSKIESKHEIEVLKQEIEALKSEDVEKVGDLNNALKVVQQEESFMEDVNDAPPDQKKIVETVQQLLSAEYKQAYCNSGNDFLMKYNDVIIPEQNASTKLIWKSLEGIQTSAKLVESYAKDGLESFQRVYEVNLNNEIPTDMPSELKQMMLDIRSQKSEELENGKEAAHILLSVAEDYKDGLVSRTNSVAMGKIPSLFGDDAFNKSFIKLKEAYALLEEHCRK